MINKRLLVKNLLAHNDENSFYDKKRKISLDTKEGKAKFLKHVCALSNSNPENNSYIVIGVEDQINKIEGVDFFDDSKIQNLINALLINPPKITYENIPFPKLPKHKVVGFVTIYPNKEVSFLSKNTWKYYKKTIFYRKGSNSLPFSDKIKINNTNKNIVEAIENSAKNNIELTLNGVFDFINQHKKNHNATYKVFKEQFVLCWAGKKAIINNQVFFSRVDIELVNEQVRLFYSALDAVKIKSNSHSFIITEYILLGLDTNEIYYPLEKTVINFKDNGKHNIVKEFLFKSPQYNLTIIKHTYRYSNKIISKIEQGISLSPTEHNVVFKLPNNYLICYLNGFLDAKKQLEKAKEYIKNLSDKTAYIKYKDVIRVLRKVKYH